MSVNYRQAIKAAIAGNRKQIRKFLFDLVNCGSYSRDKARVDQVGELVKAAMPAAFSHELVASKVYGNHHLYLHPVKKQLPILLVGHLDTLCPEDENFKVLTEVGDKLVGPGVNDMKGGDAVLIWAVKILEEIGALRDLPITCIFNGDEEQGSPDSNKIFKNMRAKAALAFVFECGGPANTVVTTRKGNCRFRLHIQGKPNHFGNLKEAKVSAIEELAKKVLALEALNRPDKSVVANVGRVEGGLAANAVAEQASLDFEFRTWDAGLQEETQAQVEDICRRPLVPGCRLSLEKLAYRPPMVMNETAQKMFTLIVELGRTLDQPISEEKRGGLSDGCWLAHVGIPTIDGLGPLGDGDFTPHEHIFTATLFDRIELAANLLLEVQKAGLLKTG
jgi:glutamate carboxypeptidase